MIKILATADIHSPRYTSLFMKSIREVSDKPDLVILAGDLVEKNNVVALKPIYNYLLEKYENVPIIAVYGNEEYRGFEYKYREMYSGFKWLNDEYVVLKLESYQVAVIGTRGALDKPTTWQARNIPGIYKYYSELPGKIARLIDEIRGKGVDIVILVSHYGVTYKNLEGEPKSIWPYLACSRFEKVIVEKKVDLVIHGHAHNGVREVIYLGETPVYNVSLPARGRVVFIEFEKRKIHVSEKPSLDKWFKY